MNSIVFLKAAYAVAWVIYLGYLAQILMRMKKVTAEREELERSVAATPRREVLATQAQRHV